MVGSTQAHAPTPVATTKPQGTERQQPTQNWMRIQRTLVTLTPLPGVRKATPGAGEDGGSALSPGTGRDGPHSQDSRPSSRLWQPCPQGVTPHGRRARASQRVSLHPQHEHSLQESRMLMGHLTASRPAWGGGVSEQADCSPASTPPPPSLASRKWAHARGSALQALGPGLPSVSAGVELTRSKWLKEARNSFICSWLMPLASLVRIWFSTSLMVLAMVVRAAPSPHRCAAGRQGPSAKGSQAWAWVTPPYFLLTIKMASAIKPDLLPGITELTGAGGTRQGQKTRTEDPDDEGGSTEG